MRQGLSQHQKAARNWKIGINTNLTAVDAELLGLVWLGQNKS